jgi:hypothetical protein
MIMNKCLNARFRILLSPKEAVAATYKNGVSEMEISSNCANAFLDV